MSPLCLALGLVLSASPSTQPPRPPDVDARAWALVQRGIAAYEREAYADARAQLRRAYALDPHPAILYAWAQAERNGGNCEAAITLYELYLETDPPERGRTLAEANLDVCREAVNRDTAAHDEADAEPEPGQPPPPQPTVVASSPAPEIAAPQPTRDTASQRPDPVVVGTLTAGTIALAGGVALIAVAQATVSEQGDVRDYDRFDTLDRRIRDLRIAGVIVTTAAVPLLVVGIVRAVRHRSRTNARRGGAIRWVSTVQGGVRF